MSKAQINNTSLADFIWKNADDLWGNFKHVEFGKIILPFTLLRRLECVLEPTREQVQESVTSLKDSGIDLDVILRQQTGFPFYNTSNYSMASLGATRTRQNLEDYISQFSENARVIFEQFDFDNTLARMDKAGVLYKICQNFSAINLHPDVVDERVMSNIYEHLIRRFGAEVNEAAEDFMTPRDVVHLAVELLLDPDDQLFVDNPGLIRTLYDPTCGTGGFLSDGMEHVRSLQDRYSIAPVIVPYGQELEPEKAKAMVVTSSRAAAVRYKKAFDAFIEGNPAYKKIHTLVAFSGKLTGKEVMHPNDDLLQNDVFKVDEEVEFSEGNMNPGNGGRDLRIAFDRPEYRVMLVANKFQTGFDQPKLVAMYVDKKIANAVEIVQTFSRLNRTFPGKDQVFIIDFVNEPGSIQAAFAQYDSGAKIEQFQDLNVIYDIKEKLDSQGVYDDGHVLNFMKARYQTAAAFNSGKGSEHKAMFAATHPRADR